MIQRIQSIYLLLAAVCMAAGFSMSQVCWEVEGQLRAGLHYCAVSNAEGQALSHPWGLICFGTLALVVSIIAIFGYKNRKRQMRIVRMAQLCALLVYPTLYAYASATSARLQATGGAEDQAVVPAVGFGIVFPLLTVIFCQLAHRAIRKDEELVRAADRIR